MGCIEPSESCAPVLSFRRKKSCLSFIITNSAENIKRDVSNMKGYCVIQTEKMFRCRHVSSMAGKETDNPRKEEQGVKHQNHGVNHSLKFKL